MDIAQLKSPCNDPIAIHFATVSATLSRNLPIAVEYPLERHVRPTISQLTFNLEGQT